MHGGSFRALAYDTENVSSSLIAKGKREKQKNHCYNQDARSTLYPDIATG